VLEVTHWPLAQQHAEAQSKRRVGLGFTGLGDALIMLGQRYDTAEAREEARKISEFMRNRAYLASSELARERGAFPLFNADLYLSGGNFASRLPADVKDKIRKHGIRNSHLLSIAPTGTISLAFADNASNGIEPPFSYTYTRRKRMADGTFKEYAVEDYAWRLYKHLGGNVDKLPQSFVTALEMSAALETLRPAWRARGLEGPEIGVGINTGPMSVGNMGSARRFDYTVVGDHVNLASRLEGLNKVFGTRILVSEFTRLAAGDGFTFREVERVAVKGRKEAVRVFELVKLGPPDPVADAWLAEFERGLLAYRARRWDEALAAFEGLQRARGDRPSVLLAERCRTFRDAPPPADWDGIWHMLGK